MVGMKYLMLRLLSRNNHGVLFIVQILNLENDRDEFVIINTDYYFLVLYMPRNCYGCLRRDE